MAAPPSTAPPVLSTPESHIFEDPTPPSFTSTSPKYSDAEIREVFEVERTVREVQEGGYQRVALQFPDGMLGDAVRVFEMLEQGCERLGPVPLPRRIEGDGEKGEEVGGLETNFNALSTTDSASATVSNGKTNGTRTRSGNGGNMKEEDRVRFYILADTSYGSCCVDEIAAEHVAADVVVHYGRSCLSPTARLPVIYVFTSHPLSIPRVVESFEQTFPEKDEKVLLMADITYHTHIPALFSILKEKGYTNVVAPEVIHDPESVVPNRRVEEDVEENLGEYALWHIAEPPNALLLTLNSRVREMYIYPTTSSQTPNAEPGKIVAPESLKRQTSILLRRRYALLTHMASAPILGILINTLSVSHHLSALSTLKALIDRAGKKSYTFVVGKVNAAKLANFSEIGGWVVVGCWESSLVDAEGFYKGVITPFELGVALQGEGRVWDGGWRGDFGALSGPVIGNGNGNRNGDVEGGELNETHADEKEQNGDDAGDSDSESESEPPEFDLRTGRYISHSRPMRTSHHPSPSSQLSSHPSSNTTNTESSKVLARRAKGDLATINGAVSPGAEYLRSQRTWTGLGSDFMEGEGGTEGEGASVEEGRGGVARGYTVAGGERR